MTFSHKLAKTLSMKNESMQILHPSLIDRCSYSDNFVVRLEMFDEF